MSSEFPQPVAVYGALRSGTTLLRLMLDQNRALKCPGESDFLFDHLVSDGSGRFDFDALAQDRIYRSFCAKVGLEAGSELSLEEMVAHMAGSDTPENKTVVLMLHRNLAHALDKFPQMKILHFVRDPRDVARSSIGMGWAGSTYYGIRHWIGTEREWAKNVPRIAPEQVLQIQYERLMEAPEETLATICAFFGVPFEDGMLDYDGTTTYSKPDPALTYQWRRKQTPREVGLVEAQLGPLLEQAGYRPSGHPLLHPGLVERVGLALQHRRATWGVRIKRFGVRDSLLVMLARRLKTPGLARGAQRRIDEKMVKYLK